MPSGCVFYYVNIRENMHKLKHFLLLSQFLLLCTAAFAQGEALISVSFQNEKATSALRRVEKLSGLRIQYNYGDVDYSVTLKAEQEKPLAVVRAIIEGHPLRAQAYDGYIAITRVSQEQQEAVDKHHLQGIVVDKNGDAVIGAIVRDRQAKTQTVTNAEGHFSIVAAHERMVLDISYLGMKPATWKGSAGDYVLVALEDDTQQLQDVVVTGYQQLDRRNLTSSVTSKNMEELQIGGVADLSKMLEGKIPDLVSLSSSGEINATNKIRIRGTSTLVGNREPLWVVDGIILTDPVELTSDVLNDPDYVNRIGNAIAGINPQDIKRIDVLKDAAATALYGTRAANGVIVVTTKSGREGKPIVSYTGQYTLRKRPYYTDEKINLMNSRERIQFSQYLVDQHYIYPSGMPKVGYEQALQNLYAGIYSQEQFESEVSRMQSMNTDWFDVLCHNSFSHDHSVSISGGSERVRYYTSVGYTDQDDVINSTTNRRYTAMSKIDMDISNKFKLQFNVNGYLNQRQYAQDENNPINYAYNTSRAIPAYHDDGSYYKYQKSGNQGWYGYSILNELDNSSVTQQTDAVTATANLRWQTTENLFFNAVFSANVQNASIESWCGEDTFYAASLRRGEVDDERDLQGTLPYGGELGKQQSKTIGWTARLQANYNKYFGDYMHNINLAGGLEASSTNYRGDNYTQRGYYKDRGRTFASEIPTEFTEYWNWVASNVPTITDTKSNLLSAYATLSYSYKSLFTLNANGRYDGSNKFGSRSNEKLLPIWSVSGNTNLREVLGLDYKWLNSLTLKASYGEQGNMLDNQTSELVIRKGNMNAYYNEMTSSAAYFANPSLKWEKTHSSNIGLELSLLDGGRLQLETEYFYKKTTDAFLSKKISDINGFESYIVNSGTIVNSGFNFTITATPVKLKNFYWIFSGNLSKIYNEVKTAPGAETYELDDFLSGSAVVQGQPVGTFYSYRFVGLSPVDGGPVFDDWEDRFAEVANADNYFTYTHVLTPSGRREPDVTGSINNTFTYRNWRLGVTLLYNFGAKTRLFRLFDSMGSSSTGGSYTSEANINRDLLNRWMKPGDELHTNIPAIIGQGNPAYYHYNQHYGMGSTISWKGATIANNAWQMYDYSDVRVVSGDYMKLSTLSLTYEFTRKQLSRLGLERLSLTATGYNLKTWCDSALRGQTPTQGGFSQVQLSDTPSYTFGITIDF